MKIGLTGSIACGKSTVSRYLRELGFAVVDADAISHALTAPGGAALPALRQAFGEVIFNGDVLNRRALGRLVFADPVQRERLNALLHPMIISEIAAQLEQLDREDTLVIGDVPLLYECHMESMFDRVWVVSAPRDAQLARLMARDGLSKDEAEQRIDAQTPLCEKEQRADAVILNAGSIDDTQRQIQALITSTMQRRQA